MTTTKGPSGSEEFATLLNELRILLPGVQVTLAFLLILPFSERFAGLTGVQRAVYLVAYVAAAMASVFLTAPGVYHRIRWREAHAEVVLQRANRLAIAGTIFLAIAIAAIGFVITDFVFGHVLTAIVTASIAGLQIWFWFGVALRDRAKHRGSRR